MLRSLPMLVAIASMPIADARAQGNCTTVDVDFAPAASTDHPFGIQMVAWLETPSGTFLDTMYITQQTGTYGIGNRPGRFDFNSGPHWPYGRRITTFPVWAHRHGLSWPAVVFQDNDDNDLSHAFNQSSIENHYCRPLMSNEAAWDAMTCATQAYTDKGVLDPVTTSLYPPRADVRRAEADEPDVDSYDVLNPFDAVSHATPQNGTLAAFSYLVPAELPAGDYVMFVEVSREFDMNATYNPVVYPAPEGIPWADYGLPYRGQPSVVYRVPFTILADGNFVARASEYAGYGDPTGATGTLHPPDSTIETLVPGSGAWRLQLIADDGGAYRLRVTSKPQMDFVAPAPPHGFQLLASTANTATLAFVSPGDDGDGGGEVRNFEVRFVTGSTPLTDENFATAALVDAKLLGGAPGAVKRIDLAGLLPETEYTVGVRATDDCHNTSSLAVFSFRTPDRELGEVDACFIATAAYGSTMARDVGLLRRFRDAVLRRSAAGELAVEAYYTFGPALSNLVGESDLLRASARRMLEPVVARTRGLAWSR